MKFTDDINSSPQDAFSGALIFATTGLFLLANNTDLRRITLGTPIILFFLVGAAWLFWRGRQMQRQKQAEYASSPETADTQ